jgi:multiple sugar transport system substrate-binding protein
MKGDIRMKLVNRTLALIVLLLAVFAGCADAKTPILLATYGAEDPMVYTRHAKVAAVFNAAHPEYELRIDAYPYNGYPEKIAVMVAAGAPPDIFQAWAQYKPQWVEQGLLLDLTERWQSSVVIKRARPYPFAEEAASYKGRIYGVPHDYNARILVLNGDLVAQAGLVQPDTNWTMEAWQTYVRRLAKPTKGVYGSQLMGHWSTVNWQWAVLFNGTGWLNDDRTDVCIEEPPMIEMLEMWLDLIYNYGAVPGPGVAAARNEWDGGYGIFAGWVSTAFDLANRVNYDWRLMTFPLGPSNGDSFAQGHLWSIPFNAAKPDQSWQVLEWFLTHEGQQAWVVHDNRQPIIQSSSLWEMYFSRLPTDQRRSVQDFLMNTLYGENRIHNMNYWTTYGELNTIMNRHLATVFSRAVSPQNAMANAAAEIRPVLRGK